MIILIMLGSISSFIGCPVRKEASRQNKRFPVVENNDQAYFQDRMKVLKPNIQVFEQQNFIYQQH